MKKHALAVGIITASVGLGGNAQAAEKLELGLFGFMEQWVGYSDQDSGFETASGNEYENVDVKDDTEIWFVAGTKLDNGIEVIAQIELLTAANNAAQFINGSFLQLSDERLGTLEIGGNDNAVWQMHHIAPDVGIENTDGDYGDWIIAPGNFVDISVTGFDLDGKAQKVNYISPSLGGFNLLGSYTPDISSAGAGGANPILATAGVSSAWAGGLAYTREFGDIAVGADVGYGSVSNNGGTVWQTGLNVIYGAFTVGGSYAVLGDQAVSGSTEGHSFDLGIAYETGPYLVSLSWLRSEAEGEVADSGEDVKDSLMLSGSYSMGPGIDLRGSLLRVEYDDETAAAANNNEGWGVVSGVVLEF